MANIVTKTKGKSTKLKNARGRNFPKENMHIYYIKDKRRSNKKFKSNKRFEKMRHNKNLQLTISVAPKDTYPQTVQSKKS